MKPDKAIDRLEEDFDLYRRCPTLVDIGVVDGLLAWMNDNLDFYVKLANKQLRLGVLQRHVAARSNRRELEEKLQAANIDLLPYDPTDDDERLTLEIQRAYFGDNSKYRKSAQLLAYARQHNDESDDAQIVSRCVSSATFQAYSSTSFLLFLTVVATKTWSTDESLMHSKSTRACGMPPREI